MKTATDIRFIGMRPSGALATLARDKAAKLDLLCPSIMACRVTVEMAHKHQRQGRPFSVRLDVTLPGGALTVSRVQNEDVYVALREAFDDMKRCIDDTISRRQDLEQRSEASLEPATPAEDERE